MLVQVERLKSVLSYVSMVYREAGFSDLVCAVDPVFCQSDAWELL